MEKGVTVLCFLYKYQIIIFKKLKRRTMKKFFAIALIAATTLVACNNGETKPVETVDSTADAMVDSTKAAVDATIDSTKAASNAKVDSAKAAADAVVDSTKAAH